MKLKSLLALSLSIALPLGVGFLGSWATTPSIPTWYQSLNKPWFNPPNWVFAPVWTTLFVLMGIACYLVWRQTKRPFQSQAIKLYILQLILNLAWSFIFFHFKLISLALLEILLLWLVLLLTIKQFKRASQTAALLLYPYLGWVSFAALLNAAIVILN